MKDFVSRFKEELWSRVKRTLEKGF